MKQELTGRQAEIFDYLKEFFIKNDQIPPILLISTHFNVYPTAVHDIFKALVRKGWIEKNDANKYRFVVDSKIRKAGNSGAGPWFDQYKEISNAR